MLSNYFKTFEAFIYSWSQAINFVNETNPIKVFLKMVKDTLVSCFKWINWSSTDASETNNSLKTFTIGIDEVSNPEMLPEVHKQGYQWPNKRNLCPPKLKKKVSRQELTLRTLSRETLALYTTSFTSTSCWLLNNGTAASTLDILYRQPYVNACIICILHFK